MEEIVIRIPIKGIENDFIIFLIENFSKNYQISSWFIITIISGGIIFFRSSIISKKAKEISPRFYQFLQVKFVGSVLNILNFISFTLFVYPREADTVYKAVGDIWFYAIPATLFLNAFFPRMAYFIRLIIVLPFLAVYTYGVSIIMEIILYYNHEKLLKRLQDEEAKSLWKNRNKLSFINKLIEKDHLLVAIELALDLEKQTNDYSDEEIYDMLRLVIEGYYKLEHYKKTKLEIVQGIKKNIRNNKTSLQDIVENYNEFKA